MSIIYEPEFKLAMEILKLKRNEAGMTQRQLADALGYTQGYVSKYEQGQVRLDIIETRRVCMILGLSLYEYVQLLEERIKQLQ